MIPIVSGLKPARSHDFCEEAKGAMKKAETAMMNVMQVDGWWLCHVMKPYEIVWNHKSWGSNRSWCRDKLSFLAEPIKMEDSITASAMKAANPLN